MVVALAALIVLSLGASALAAAEQDAPSREYLIKSAILYNFARFTEWPEQAFAERNEFRLCILGTDPFGAALSSIEGKPVQGRPLTAVRLNDPADTKNCHLVYISESAETLSAQVIGALDDSPVLTVSETPLFNRGGGHIEMLTVDDRVRFGINQAGAERAGLKFSAKLLNLADPTLDAMQKTRYATPK